MSTTPDKHTYMPPKAHDPSASLKPRQEDRQRFIERHYQQSTSPAFSSPSMGITHQQQYNSNYVMPYDAAPNTQYLNQPTNYYAQNSNSSYNNTDYTSLEVNNQYPQNGSSSQLPPIPTIRTNFAPKIDTHIRQSPTPSRSPISQSPRSPSPRADSLPSTASPRISPAGGSIFQFPLSTQPQQQAQVYQPVLFSPPPSRNNTQTSENILRPSPSTSAIPSSPIEQRLEPVFSKSTPPNSQDSSSSSRSPLQKDKKLSEGDAYCEQAIKYHEAGELQKATNYFRLAAEHQSPTGMFLYGISLRHGWGCNPNPNLAFQYLQKAAENAVEDLSKLSSVHKSASRGELVMAIYELGVSFRHGWGVPKNKVTACYYFNIAAELGDADAQNDLAECYANGHGVKKDMYKAAKFYRLAHAQGRGIVGNSWIFKEKYDKACSPK